MLKNKAITIRAGRRADRPVIERFIKKLALYHGERQKINQDFLTQALFGRGKKEHCWLAMRGEKPVGFIMTRDWDNVLRSCVICHIDLMFVEEKERSQGIGEKLMGVAKTAAKKRGCARLTVEALGTNKGAISFYEQKEFIKRGDDTMRFSQSL